MLPGWISSAEDELRGLQPEQRICSAGRWSNITLFQHVILLFIYSHTSQDLYVLEAVALILHVTTDATTVKILAAALNLK